MGLMEKGRQDGGASRARGQVTEELARGRVAKPPARAEKGAGFPISRALPKLGYKGVESCELSFSDFRVPVTAPLGGEEGRGSRR